MATIKELEAQLETARKDIETLTRAAGERATAAAHSARDEALAYMDDLSDETRAMVEQARVQGQQLRDLAEEQVRKNPLMTIGLAVGAGFLLAGLLRR